MVEMLQLDDDQKLRAFMAFISDESNIPLIAKKHVDDLSVLIEADIVKHLDKNIEDSKEWIKYGKEDYKEDLKLVNAKASELRAQEARLGDQRLAQYYHIEYAKDKDFITEHAGKKK
jgi:hypothetical protein